MVTALDMAGLAQKGGPVTTHIRIAATEEELHATRISSGEAAVLIGCDMVVSASPETIFKLRPDYTRAVVNNDFSITSEFVRAFAIQAQTGNVAAHPDPVYQREAMEKVIADACGPGRADFLPATRLATALMGDSIATNPFLLGYAYQKGMLPVSADLDHRRDRAARRRSRAEPQGVLLGTARGARSCRDRKGRRRGRR